LTIDKAFKICSERSTFWTFTWVSGHRTNYRNFKMLGKFSIRVPAVSSPTQIPWQKEKEKERGRERERATGY
jgi:hypothetical protein